MPYATLDSLIDRYGEALLVQLTDRGVVPTGAIDQDVTERGRIDAEALVDGYLGVKYALPLAEVPPLIADITRRIWLYNLHPHTPDDKVKADYEAALRQLRDIAGGTLTIPAAGLAPAVADGMGAQFTDRDRDFSPETMTGFI